MAFTFQFRLRPLLILTVLALLLGLGRWMYLNFDEYHVTTLCCGEGRQIVITADTAWEISQPIRYRVMVDGEAVTTPCYFYCASETEKLRFRLVIAEKGELVGVLRAGEDQEYLVILHDFLSGESWPGVARNHSKPLNGKNLLNAVDRLCSDNPGLRKACSWTIAAAQWH
jgi:hypothetical protein